jgi:RecA/RadA recombinase
VEVEELILVRNQEAADTKLRAKLDSSNHHVAINAEATPNHLEPSDFPIRLLIVDSIAAPTKRGFGCESAPERAAAVFQCAQRLKQLAHQLQVAVLVVNQVFLDQRSDFGTLDSNSTVGANDRVAVKATLGTSWHHCVSTRILLEQQQQQNGDDANSNNYNKEDRVTRTATIVKSNVVGLQSATFEVSGAGVVDTVQTLQFHP